MSTLDCKKRPRAACPALSLSRTKNNSGKHGGMRQMSLSARCMSPEKQTGNGANGVVFTKMLYTHAENSPRTIRQFCNV
jgi:hypothetical protein